MRRQEDGSAIVSSCGRFRYELRRSWGFARGDGAELVWILLNPSRADAAQDDPTIRRLVGFASRWGYFRLRVLNLFAYRSPRPQDLVHAAQELELGLDGVVGPDNDAYLKRAAREADRIVVGWGARGKLWGRDQEVVSLLRETSGTSSPLWMLGKNADESPKHPLYIRADQELEVYASLEKPVRTPHAQGVASAIGAFQKRKGRGRR